MLIKKIFTYLLVLILNAHYLPTSFAAKIVNIEKHDSPSEIAFFDEHGEKHFLDQLEGKTLLIVFWATWCASCEKEMPDLDILAKDFRKLPFEIITLSQDFQGMETVKKFFKSRQIRHLKAYHDYHNQLFAAFSVVGLPSSFLINAEGKIVVNFNGIVNWYDPDIRNILLSHISGNPEMPKNSHKVQDLHKSNNITNKNSNITSKNSENRSKQLETLSKPETQSAGNQSFGTIPEIKASEEHDSNDDDADLLNILQ
ncbi:MAG: TlpA disulfide reductase family protein [Janthinobacterium lividum]